MPISQVSTLLPSQNLVYSKLAQELTTQIKKAVVGSLDSFSKKRDIKNISLSPTVQVGMLAGVSVCLLAYRAASAAKAATSQGGQPQPLKENQVEGWKSELNHASFIFLNALALSCLTLSDEDLGLPQLKPAAAQPAADETTQTSQSNTQISSKKSNRKADEQAVAPQVLRIDMTLSGSGFGSVKR